MKPSMNPDGLLEHLALWGNLGPVPVAEAMFGMATSRVLMAGVRLGVFAELALGPRSAEDLARNRGLDPAGARHLLDSLCALGHVRRAGFDKHWDEMWEGVIYSLAPRARKWLDPGSPTYIGPFLEFNYDQWEWWANLEEVVKSGTGAEIHGYGEEDPRWERYIRAMFVLARLSAPEVARKIRIPSYSEKLLDIAGGHGWFAAELCKLHPRLRAMVIDLPGSARVGRNIIRENGMAESVEHRDGDALSDDLGGPHDAALCFQLIHHLSPEQNVVLFRRVRAALKPGGIFALLDYFAPPEGSQPDSSAFLGLHFFITSQSDTYSEPQVRDWLKEAGFVNVSRVRLLRIPVQRLLRAERGD